MTAHLPITHATDAPPRARGSVQLSAKHGPRGTVLDTLYQKGAANAVFPRADRGMTAVLLNTSGGVTGGDRFDYVAAAGPDTHLTLTTQACERAYRALPGEVGRIDTTLSVAADATLWWLPQETLVFDGCALSRRLTCALAPTARALIVEPICFGRLAMGEDTITGAMSDRVEITRGGTPLVLDAWRMAGDLGARMSHTATGGGARAMVSLTYVAPDAAGHLEPVRDLAGPAGGASLLTDDTLVMRLLAPSGYALRQRLLPILDHLTGSALPLCWRL